MDIKQKKLHRKKKKTKKKKEIKNYYQLEGYQFS